MPRGLLDFVGLAVTTAFAVPLFVVSMNFFSDGKTELGVALLVIIAVMFFVEEYVTAPSDLPGKIAQKTVGTVAVDEDAEEE